MKLLNLLIIKVKRAIIKCIYLIDIIHVYKKIKKFRHELDYVKKKMSSKNIINGMFV